MFRSYLLQRGSSTQKPVYGPKSRAHALKSSAFTGDPSRNRSASDRRSAEHIYTLMRKDDFPDLEWVPTQWSRQPSSEPRRVC